MGRRAGCLKASSTSSRGGGGGGGAAAAAYGGVAALALGCYVNALWGDFVHDDIPAVTRNRDVLGLSPLAQLLRNDFWGTNMADVTSHKSYRPLTTLTFRANHLVSGLQPLSFHALNVVLHLGCSLLFTRVCHGVAGLSAGFASIAGLLFAAHPIHTEAVTGIVGRADVLACIFFLLSIIAYHDPDYGGRVTASTIFAGLAMLAKETGVMVLLINFLYDFYRSWASWKRSILELRWSEDTLLFSRRAGKVLMSLGVVLVSRLALLQGSLPKFSHQDNPAAFHPCPQVRLLTFCYLAALNCWLVLCPATLSHDWQFGSVPLVTSLADARNIATCIFFGCCILAAYRSIMDFEIQQNPALVLGVLLVTLPFLPASNIVVTVGFVLAERVLYIPSMGVVLLVVFGWQQLWQSRQRQRSLLLVGILFLLAFFCVRTVVRNRDWSSREALLASGLRALPHNAKLHYNFANFLRDSGNKDAAMLHYKKALRLWPSYASAHNNLGTLMSTPEEAEAHFLSAIRYSPAHVNAHYNLGHVYRRSNRTEEARRVLQRCTRLDPLYAPAFLLLAQMQRGQAAGSLLRTAAGLEITAAGLPPTAADNGAAQRQAAAHTTALYAHWLLHHGRPSEAIWWSLKGWYRATDNRHALLAALKSARALGQYARMRQFQNRWITGLQRPRKKLWLDTQRIHPLPCVPIHGSNLCNEHLDQRDANKSRQQMRSHVSRAQRRNSGSSSGDGSGGGSLSGRSPLSSKTARSRSKGRTNAQTGRDSAVLVGNIMDTW